MFSIVLYIFISCVDIFACANHSKPHSIQFKIAVYEREVHMSPMNKKSRGLLWVSNRVTISVGDFRRAPAFDITRRFCFRTWFCRNLSSTPWKLTWHYCSTSSNGGFSMIFHCHVRFRGGKLQIAPFIQDLQSVRWCLSQHPRCQVTNPCH